MGVIFSIQVSDEGGNGGEGARCSISAMFAANDWAWVGFVSHVWCICLQCVCF